MVGGSLMGAVGLNGAAAAVDAPEQRLRVANTGWALGERLMQAGDAPVEGRHHPLGCDPE